MAGWSEKLTQNWLTLDYIRGERLRDSQFYLCDAKTFHMIASSSIPEQPSSGGARNALAIGGNVFCFQRKNVLDVWRFEKKIITLVNNVRQFF